MFKTNFVIVFYLHGYYNVYKELIMKAIEVKKIRKKLGLTQSQFADKLKVTSQTIHNWENGVRNVSPPMEILLSYIANSTPNKESAKLSFSKHYKEVPIVPHHAMAGFLSNYGDQEYIEELPIEIWAVDREYKGNYFVFEVQGDSMDNDTSDSILDGDKLLCREIQRHYWKHKLHIKKWFFVIAHRMEGIIVKQIINHDTVKGTITCHSLNPLYKDFDIELNDVVALFNIVDIKRSMRR